MSSDDEQPGASMGPRGEPGEPDAPGGGHDEQLPEPDGLDLARAIARATAAGGVPAKRRRPRRADRPQGGRVSGAHPDDRDPQTLSATLRRIIGDRGWELDLRVHGVFARWPELVGDDIAGHTTPESFNDGRLTVRTDSTAWATQLTLLAPQLVRRLNEELGAGTVVAIDVLGPQGPTWKRGPRSIRGARGPRDTYG